MWVPDPTSSSDYNQLPAHYPKLAKVVIGDLLSSKEERYP
jgi:hypothetical protein